MTKRTPAANGKEAQIERIVAAVRRAGLTVYGVRIEPRSIYVSTQPVGESPATIDSADEWLRANDAVKAHRRA